MKSNLHEINQLLLAKLNDLQTQNNKNILPFTEKTENKTFEVIKGKNLYLIIFYLIMFIFSDFGSMYFFKDKKIASISSNQKIASIFSNNQAIRKICETRKDSTPKNQIQDYSCNIDKKSYAKQTSNPEPSKKRLLTDNIEEMLIEMIIKDWQETKFHIDDELVNKVHFFVKYYSVKYMERTNRTIKRSKKYMFYIKNIFRKYNIPEELAFAVPFVESSFIPTAKSNKGAIGMFQILKETAKLYNLKIKNKIDERRDYKKAAVACAKYLRDNRYVFGSIVLALGSYHHGTGRMTQLLLIAPKSDPRNYSSIYNKRKIGKYSKQYIPQLLAACIIYRTINSMNLTCLPKNIK